MKKIFLILTIFFGVFSNVNAETNRIISGDKNAKITIIAYESLTCSHCADFHIDIYPQLKKDYLDTGIAKIEFRHFKIQIFIKIFRIIYFLHWEDIKVFQKIKFIICHIFPTITFS